MRKIASCAFCDNGAQIELDTIGEALDVDRGAGFHDPTATEVELLVQGGPTGEPPKALCVQHPALDALLTREMT